MNVANVPPFTQKMPPAQSQVVSECYLPPVLHVSSQMFFVTTFVTWGIDIILTFV